MPSKFLFLASSVSLLCALISGVFFFMHLGLDLTNSSNEKMNSVIEDLYKESLQARTGDTVTGLQVHSMLKQPQAGVTYKVTTAKNPLGFYYFEDINDTSSSEYIDAATIFVVHNHFSDDGMLIGVSFVESGMTETKFVADGYGTNMTDAQQQDKLNSIASQISLLQTKISMLTDLTNSLNNQTASVQASIDTIAGDRATTLAQLEDEYEALRVEYNRLYKIYYKAITDIDYDFDFK